jgi:small subunit ribosomal protein S16
MLVIRFFRISKKNQPSFKLVVTDKRKSSVKGTYVEEVGFLDPLKDKKFLRSDRIKYWLSVGAKPSPTVYNLLISEKIIEGKKIPKFKKSKKKEEKKAEAPVATATAAVPTEPAAEGVKKEKEEKVPEKPKAPETKPKEVKSKESKTTETPEKKSETK